MFRRFFPLLALFFALIFWVAPAVAAISNESAYQIAEAYQMEGVSDAVRGMVAQEIRKELNGKVKEWTIEVFEDVGIKERKFKKQEVKKKLKAKLKKFLPKIAKKVLYEKLFLGQFGEEVGKVKEVVDGVITELKTNFNDHADKIISKWYDKAVQQIDEHIKQQLGPVYVDMTDVRGTLDRALKMENIEWGLGQVLSSAVGESTAEALQKRMKDVLTHELPPEAHKYLDYGPEKFAEYAAKIEDNLPGKKFQEMKNKLLHTPLFVLPNGVYCGILAASAAKHFAAAYKGPVVDPYELKRGIEVSRVMIWQAKNKEGFSVDLKGLLDAIKTLSDTFGISLDNLGVIGDRISDVKDAFKELEGKLNELDGLIKDKIDLVKDKIDKVVGEIKDGLTKVQDSLFKPAIYVYEETKEGLQKVHDTVLKELPEKFHGIPGSWEDFKDQFGIDPGIFGKAGEKSLWDIMQDFAKKHGLDKAYEKFKEDMKRTADDINDAVSGALAAAATEVVDGFGFTDQLARAMDIEYVPEKNPSDKNPTDPVLLHNGEYYHQMIDLFIPGKGLHYEFKRTYRSRANFKGALGYNWTHNYDERLLYDGNQVIHLDSEGRKFATNCEVVCVGTAGPVAADPSCGQGYCPRKVLRAIPRPHKKEQINIMCRTSSGIKTHFNERGLMIAKEDAAGNRMTFEHDRFGRVTKVVDTLGREIEYKYNSVGLLAEVRDFIGRTITFDYNNDDDLIGVTGPKTFDFPKGKTVRYHYSTGYYEDEDLNHNITLIMDPKGQIFIRNQYGETGIEKDMVISQQYGEGSRRIWISYKKVKPVWLIRFIGKQKDEPVDEVVVADKRGVLHIYRHNAWGNVIEEYYIDEFGRKVAKREVLNPKSEHLKPARAESNVEYEYDKVGNIVNAVYETGKKTNYMLNGLNQVIKESSGDEYAKEYFFDENDNLIEVRIKNRGGLNADEVGEELVYKYKYDEMDNLIEKIEPVSKDKFLVTKYEYDPEGRLTRTVYPEGNSVRYIYDATGLLVRMVRGEDGPDEQVIIFEYDEAGKIAAFRDGAGNKHELNEDEFKDEEKEEKKNNDYRDSENEHKYDSRGNIVEITSPNGRKVKYLYDGLGRRIESRRILENGRVITTYYEWDGNNRLVSIADGAGAKTRFNYDSLDRLISEKYPDGGEIKYFYDRADNIVEMEYQNGTVVKQIFDEGGRVSYRNIERAKGVKGTTEQFFAYDEDGRLIHSYDNNDPDDPKDDSEIFYKYDAEGRLIAEIQNNYQVVKNFNKGGRANIIKYPSGTRIDRKYEDTKLQAVFMNGKKLTKPEYEAAATTSNPRTPPKCAWAFGKNGNLSSWCGFRYFYDGFNRLVEVYKGDDLTAKYAYDAHNRRILKELGEARKHFIYDGWNAIEEYKNGTLAFGYIYGEGVDSQIAMVDHLDGGKKYYYHKNYLGSVIAVSDEKGNAIEEYKYTTYGILNSLRAESRSEDLSSRLRSNSNKLFQPYTFTGRRFDGETGLYYFRNRYYSPDMQKFITRDPLGYKVAKYTTTEGVNPFHLSFHRRRNLAMLPNNFTWLTGREEGVSNINRFVRRPFVLRRSGETDLYAYAGGDPARNRDPFGLDYLWVSGEYKPYSCNKCSGRIAELDVIWVEEADEDGNMRASVKLPIYHAVSGPWGNGPLPPGDYRGHTLRRRSDKKGMIIEGFGWSLNIDPDFTTSRSLLRIHPDGNAFGSLGCIAIDKEGYIDLYDRMNEYMEENLEIDVHVRIRETGTESADPTDRLINSHVNILTSN